VDERSERNKVLSLTTEAAIRLALLATLLAACLHIVWPFVLPVIWGVIIAIAVMPLVRRLTVLLGGRQRLAAGLFALLALAALIVPCWLIAKSVTDALVSVGEELASGNMTIPAPPEDVADWPIIGGELESIWTKAAEDPPAAVKTFQPQIKAIGGALLSAVANVGIGVLQFAFSIVLAGVFLATAKGGARAAGVVAARVAGEERGQELVNTAVDTVNSVVKGVIGVAAVQAGAATIGMVVAGVPAATTWGLLILLLAVVQLPIAVVLLPMIFYVFSTTSTVGAVLFLIWTVIVSVSDTFLKPLFLGRGMETPMLVILIGSLGGMLAWGMLGLFVGAVVLAVGYQLAGAWFNHAELASLPAEEPASG